VTEEDSIALQAWLELADWTGKDVSLHTSGQMRERMSIHPSGLLKQWLVEEESRQGLLRENEPAKMFEECQRKLDRLANLLNTAPALEEADEVESIPVGYRVRRRTYCMAQRNGGNSRGSQKGSRNRLAGAMRGTITKTSD
jgi:hypothetical protein